MEQNAKQQLEKIISVNRDLRERVKKEDWSISYNRKADMLLMGGIFPTETFYFPLNDSRVMVRIDKDYKIYGYAIENAKAFIRENPEEGLILSFIVYPVRSLLFKLPLYFLAYQTAKGIESMRAIWSISNYVAGRAAYVN